MISSNIAVAAEKVDPVDHYVETGEWLGPDERTAEGKSEAPETPPKVYPTTYSTPEEAQAAYRAEEEERVIEEWERIDSQTQLRKYDQLALEARKDFDEAKDVPAPFSSPQGYVMFPYGAVVPRIVCRPYRVSDIVLEPGEEILGIHAGDTVRWLFSPSVSMQGQQKVSHIVVKPTMAGISTNLMVHTNRRAYQLDLISSETDAYTPGVAFTYPNQDLNSLFGASQNRGLLTTPKEQKDVGMPMDQVNAGYKIAARYHVDWKPVAVFDDGLKTYIRMPARISEAPALFIRLDGKDTLVNYRVHGRYYIVDRLFDRAYLKVGSRRVAIVRNETLAKENMFEDEIKVRGNDK